MDNDKLEKLIDKQNNLAFIGAMITFILVAGGGCYAFINIVSIYQSGFPYLDGFVLFGIINICAILSAMAVYNYLKVD